MLLYNMWKTERMFSSYAGSNIDICELKIGNAMKETIKMQLCFSY